MKRSHILLFGADSFGIGLLVPVMSLVFLTRGATLENLSLCIGVFATAVVTLELPSGILADMFGRKRIYLISTLFVMSYYLLLLISRHFPVLSAACVLHGIGRAFSSGSVEALEIESYMQEHGKDGLAKISSTMTAVKCTGLSLGSISGGLMGYLDPSYTLLLVSAVGLQLLIILITLFCVREPQRENPPLSFAMQFKDHIRGLTVTLRHSLPVTAITLIMLPFGMLLSSIEIYWQPALDTFLPPSLSWIFGIVTCLGYFGNSIGSKAAEFILKRQGTQLTESKRWKLYWLSRYLFIIAAACLGFIRQTWLFLLLFVMIYIMIGAGELIENTVFHSCVANSQRASMMSVQSLTMRGGGLITSLIGGLIITGLSFSAIWIIIPLFTALAFCIIMISFCRSFRLVPAET